MKQLDRKFYYSIAILTLLVSPLTNANPRVTDKCEELFYSASAATYPQDAFVNYNMGAVYGYAGTAAGQGIYFPEQSRGERYIQGGTAAYHVVVDRQAFFMPGAPGTPGFPANINSTDPRVSVTAQARGNDFMNVTFQGPRNLVLAQILKLSQAPAQDLIRFQEIYPISSREAELPAAIELHAQIERAYLLQEQQDAAREAALLVQRAEEARAQEAREQQRLQALEEAQKQERLRQENTLRQERERQENAARIEEERRQLAIKERDLSGFDDEVEISLSYSTVTSTFGGSGMGRTQRNKPVESAATEAGINKIKEGLKGLRTTELKFKFAPPSLFLGRPSTKAYAVTVRLVGTRRDIVKMIARGASLFPPGMGFGTEREMVQNAIAVLDQAYPPKTPVKSWQAHIISHMSSYFFGEGRSNRNGSNSRSASPVWDNEPGAGSPVWDGAPGAGSPVWGG